MYPGGKNGMGVWQTILNQMPPHEVYIEAFLGSGAVLRHKRPAPRGSIAIDSDKACIDAFPAACVPGLALVCADAVSWLPCYPFRGGELVYADPPYLMETRSSKRPIYRHEMGTETEHIALLNVLLALPCRVILSGYASSLYTSMLPGWRTVSFPAMTRGGRLAEEWLWMNYPEPTELHDYRYLGSGFRERERIKRKKARWQERLRRMPAQERYALLAAIEEYSLAENGEGSGK